MAEVNDDPREVPWHPRFAQDVRGHEAALQMFQAAWTAGKPHHAWMLSGPAGIGKATFSYVLAKRILSGSAPEKAAHWIEARAHPDLFVLERGLNDSKPRRLRQEISVEDARHLSEFFARTSGSGGWRVAIIDSADDLNRESANALLKLVEEPPPKAILFLVCHNPGATLRTLRSRCLKVPMSPLSQQEAYGILKTLPLDPAPGNEDMERSARQSGGSPGKALNLLSSAGAKAFETFVRDPRGSDATLLAVANGFSMRQQALADYGVFFALLLDWLAQQAVTLAASATGSRLSALHSALAERNRVVEAYNLDRRIAVLEALRQLRDALKAA